MAECQRLLGKMDMYFRLKKVSIAFRMMLDARPACNERVAKEARDEGYTRCQTHGQVRRSACLCVRLARRLCQGGWQTSCEVSVWPSEACNVLVREVSTQACQGSRKRLARLAHGQRSATHPMHTSHVKRLFLGCFDILKIFK